MRAPAQPAPTTAAAPCARLGDPPGLTASTAALHVTARPASLRLRPLPPRSAFSPWQIAVQYNATTAAPSGSTPEQADSGARGQAEWAGGIAWPDDPAGALADPAGALAVALHAAGRRGYAGAWPPRVRGGLVEDTCPRKRWLLIEGRG